MGRVAERIVGVGIRYRVARIGQHPHAPQAVVDVVVRPTPVHPQPVCSVVVVSHQSVRSVVDCTLKLRQQVRVVYSERETTDYEPQTPRFYQRVQAASASRSTSANTTI